jgi:exonuclease SbcC
MLKALAVYDFQCHAKRVINFDPGITVLTGCNGAGKSALMRALRWVCFNQWPGPADSFIAHGKELAHVKLWTESSKIERLKGKQDGRPVNLYRLDGADLAFDSVDRRSTPNAVRIAHRLTADNFQGQFDAQFWFSLSSGDVAKALNKIVNLDAIDRSLACVSSDLRTARAEASVCEQRLESCTNLTESLAWTEQANEQLSSIEAIEQQIASISARIDAVETSISEAAGIASLRDNASELILGGKKAINAYLEAARAATRLQSTESAINQIQELDACQKRSQTLLKQSQDRLRKALEQRCPLCNRAP